MRLLADSHAYLALQYSKKDDAALGQEVERRSTAKASRGSQIKRAANLHGSRHASRGRTPGRAAAMPAESSIRAPPESTGGYRTEPTWPPLVQYPTTRTSQESTHSSGCRIQWSQPPEPAGRLDSAGSTMVKQAGRRKLTLGHPKYPLCANLPI